MTRISGNGGAQRWHRQRALIVAMLALGACWLLLAAVYLRQPPAATAQDAYPTPFIPQINPIGDGSNLDDSFDGYPAPTDAAPGVIGSEALPSPLDFPPAAVPAQTATTPEVPTQSSSGLLFLWGGFTAALLIFITAVVGSVVLFARRAEP